jgi:hypothetical protein
MLSGANLVPQYVAEFNSIAYVAFFKYCAMGAGLSVIGSLVCFVATKQHKMISKYIAATILIIPLTIFLWWRLYIFIPRIGSSERFMAWELGASYGILALLAWWIAPLITIVFAAKVSDKKRALAIAFGVVLGFFVGAIATGRYQSFRGGGPVLPVYGFLIGPILFGLIGNWIGNGKSIIEPHNSEKII